MELSHADLEKYHYQEIKQNPLYALDGMMDVLREELMMNWPLLGLADIEDRISNLEAISAEPGQIPRRYHDRLEQMQGEVVYLRNKLIAAKKTASQYGGLKVART